MSRAGFLFLLLGLLSVAPIAAHAGNNGNSEKCPSPSMNLEEAKQITEAINNAQGKSEQIFKVAVDAVVAASKDLSLSVNKTLIAQSQLRLKSTQGEMPFSAMFMDILRDHFDSIYLTDIIRRDLNMVNEQTVLGYPVVVGAQSQEFAGINKTEGVYSKGNLPAAANLYETHVRLFCIPGTQNAPPGCGELRDDAGMNGVENFTDFLVGEKTWKKTYVLDVLKLSRAYFGLVSDTSHLESIKVGRGEFVRKQGVFARNNLRMALINHLAARRAPSSTASDLLQTILFGNLANSGKVRGIDANDLCTRDSAKLTMYERTVCSYTNEPIESGYPRVISQAAMERITQYDFYLSPEFFNTIKSPNYNKVGAMDKMEVFIKAQQLAQDYQQLRLLQMKTAATAMNIMGGGY